MFYRDFYVEHSDRYNSYYVIVANENFEYLCRDLQIRNRACDATGNMFSMDTAWYKPRKKLKRPLMITTCLSLQRLKNHVSHANNRLSIAL